MNKIKILIKHPEIRDYREPFFKKLLDYYDLTFILNKEPKLNNIRYEIIGTSYKSLWLDIPKALKFLKIMWLNSYDVFFTSTSAS